MKQDEITNKIGQLLADEYDGIYSYILFANTTEGIKIVATEEQNTMALLRSVIETLHIIFRELAERIDKYE